VQFDTRFEITRPRAGKAAAMLASGTTSPDPRSSTWPFEQITAPCIPGMTPLRPVKNMAAEAYKALLVPTQRVCDTRLNPQGHAALLSCRFWRCCRHFRSQSAAVLSSSSSHPRQLNVKGPGAAHTKSPGRFPSNKQRIVAANSRPSAHMTSRLIPLTPPFSSDAQDMLLELRSRVSSMTRQLALRLVAPTHPR